MAIISVFFIVLVAAFAVAAFVTEPSKADKLIHSRLVSLDKKVVANIDDEAGIVKEITFSAIPAFDKVLRQNALAMKLQLLIEQAGVKWTVGRFAFTTLAFVAIGAALGNWWIAPGLLGWTPSVLCVLPYLFLVQKSRRRLQKFASLLPHAIELMSRSLRAGQAVPATLDIVAREIEDPLGAEFRRTADEQSFGLPFREAMLNLSRRVPLADLHFLVTAILVQKETGGNLANILDKTSHVIRERIRVEGQTRIRTAQGRITGWVMCALPFVLFGLFNILSPGYGRVLFENPAGIKMVEVAAVLMVLGIFTIRKIVSIKI